MESTPPSGIKLRGRRNGPNEPEHNAVASGTLRPKERIPAAPHLLSSIWHRHSAKLTGTTDNPGTTSETGEPAPGSQGEESEANTGPQRDVYPCQQPLTGRQPSQGC